MARDGSGTGTKAVTERADTPAQREKLTEQALQKKRLRLSQHAKLASFLQNISPQDANRVLNESSVEMIALFLSQTPELVDLLTDWGAKYFDSLDTCSISDDISRLENLGVKAEAISVGMRAIAMSALMDKSFSRLGNKRERRQLTRRLTSPVNDLRNLAVMFENESALLWEEIPNPSIIAIELELLSSMLNWGHIMYDFLGANHLLEVSKFALSSLVHETTGRFLDREVSNLISVALDNCDYDETRHRVWRSDNYRRLQQNIPIVTRILLAINSAVPSRSTTT